MTEIFKEQIKWQNHISYSLLRSGGIKLYVHKNGY